MNKPEDDIRESLLNTLHFLASEEEQQEFAKKVYYDTYHDEFACWWFDTFFPEDHIFNKVQISILVEFSEIFDTNLDLIEDNKQTIEQLQKQPEWQKIVASAKNACEKLKKT